MSIGKYLVNIIVLIVATAAIAITIRSRNKPVPLPATSTVAVISIENNRFIPTSLTVSVGETVSFTNNDSTAHQVASNPHPVHTDYPPLNIGWLSPKKSSDAVLTKKGTFGFHDHLNPSIKGQVVVE